MIEKIDSAKLPTKYGDFTILGYRAVSGEEYVVLTKGDASGDDVLVRVHSACLTGDVFHSRRCDCGNQLEMSIRAIDEEERGVVVYVASHEGRGIGILNKVKAYHLQDDGLDTVDANKALGFEEDLRDYSQVVEILKELGVSSVRLLTNNPAKVSGFDGSGIKVKRVPIVIPKDKVTESYMETKKNRMGHML
ncbi:MAG: GTP cyclohydrolase II [Candidatus Altiarchaeota archaeon]